MHSSVSSTPPLKSSPRSVTADLGFADSSGHDSRIPPKIPQAPKLAERSPESIHERIRSIMEKKRQQNRQLEEVEGLKDNSSSDASGPSNVLHATRNRLKKYLPSNIRSKKEESAGSVQLQDEAGPHTHVASTDSADSAVEPHDKSRSRESDALKPIVETYHSSSFDSSDDQLRDMSCGADVESTSVCPSVTTSHPASKEEVMAPGASEEVTRIMNLPWSENLTDIVVSGRYTGPVNMKLQPHGGGLLVVEGVTFEGVWTHGRLSTRLAVYEDEPVVSGDNEKKRAKQMSIRYIISKRSKNSNPNTAAAPKYQLGDASHSPKDMIVKKSKSEATHSASILMKWEHCFVKRSDGVWTAAILVDRGLQPRRRKKNERATWHSLWDIDSSSMDLEESMLFVVNENADTKIIGRSCWGKYVRRMSVHAQQQ